MNNLEKHILENRDELDRMEDVPEEAMWQNIRHLKAVNASAKQAPNYWKSLAISAFVLALAGWGMLFFQKQTPTPPAPADSFRAVPETAPSVPDTSATKSATKAVSPPIAQLEKEANPAPPSRKTPQNLPQQEKSPTKTPPRSSSKEESRLQQLVASKQREIGFERLKRADFEGLFKELDELDNSVEQARQDATGLPQNERLMQTLIKYYELKIRILEQISNEINKKEYHEGLEKSI